MGYKKIKQNEQKRNQGKETSGNLHIIQLIFYLFFSQIIVFLEMLS
jgi:hypothetical protein